MQIKPILHLTRTSNANLLLLIKRVALMLDSNPFYPGLTNPTIAELNSIAQEYDNAISAWGSMYNHGSSVDKETLKEIRLVAAQALRNVSSFCENKTPNNAIAFTSAGFETTKTRFRVGRLPKVEHLRQFFSRTIPLGAVRLKWNRPSGVGKNCVKTYLVFHSTVPDPNTATQLAITTKASYLDKNAGNRASNYYWIIPIGAAGNGVISDMIAGYPTGPAIS